MDFKFHGMEIVDGGSGRLLSPVLEKDAVTQAAGGGNLPHAEAHPDAAGGPVREMLGAVEPPDAVVVPEMMVEPAHLLARGEAG